MFGDPRNMTRLQQTASVQIEHLMRRAAASQRTGDLRDAKRHALEAAGWQALLGRRGAQPARAARSS